jgi:hypothetical protein
MHGHRERRVLWQLAADVRREYREARDRAEQWDARQSLAPDIMVQNFMVQNFFRGQGNWHPLWSLAWATGRLDGIGGIGEFDRDRTLGAYMALLAECLKRATDQLVNRLRYFTQWGSPPNNDLLFQEAVYREIDGLAVAIIHAGLIRDGLRAAGAPLYRLYRASLTDARLESAAAYNLERAECDFREIEDRLGALADTFVFQWHSYTSTTLRLFSTTRLLRVAGRYRVGTLPVLLSGRFDGLPTASVCSGLARTYALSLGTEFPDAPAVMNGVLADYLEDKDQGPPEMIADLRKDVTGLYCPSLDREDAYRPL